LEIDNKNVDESAVKELNDDNFEQIVMDNTNNVIVFFYAPWCSHSQELRPIWAELGKSFQQVVGVKVAKMDATKYENAADIRYYPTVRMYPVGFKQPIEHTGPKNIDDLTDFILKYSNRRNSTLPQSLPIINSFTNNIAKQSLARKIKDEL